uniref:Uncharacterized protein n=1 Tax=Arundo donax TaxID=35708 RepID=A0A0A8YJS4_ARUDO
MSRARIYDSQDGLKTYVMGWNYYEPPSIPVCWPFALWINPDFPNPLSLEDDMEDRRAQDSAAPELPPEVTANDAEAPEKADDADPAPPLLPEMNVSAYAAAPLLPEMNASTSAAAPLLPEMNASTSAPRPLLEGLLRRVLLQLHEDSLTAHCHEEW